MHRWLLSPRWLGLHAVLVLALVLTGVLGWWQLDRARAQHTASQQHSAATAAAPVPLTTLLAGATQVGPGQAGRAVTLTGHYDPAHQLLVPGRPLHGQPGYLVVAPLVSDSGRAVMVDRGWLPAGEDGRPPAVPAPPQGTLSVTGWLSGPDPMPERAARAEPSGTTPQVMAVNAAVLVNVVPYPVVDGYVHRASAEPGAPGPGAELTAVPRPVQGASGTWPLQNLFYALQWWVFGAAAVWLWLAMVRHEYDDRRRELDARVQALAARR
ncbi:MAG TPA: SURF1 family protein [Actinomycetes bacterium]|nr:SURF1 family protein [Actinomycetes bacterium]